MERLTLYQQLYQTLLDDIAHGKYADGERLPSEKELSEQHGVSRITSKRALNMLVENGYITRSQGKGSFLTERRPAPAADPHARVIGFIAPDVSEGYGLQLLLGVEGEANDRGMSLLFRRSFGSVDRENAAIEEMRAAGACGLILMPVHGEYYNPHLLRLLLDGYPIVLIDRSLSGIPATYVGTDNLLAGRRAAEYLLDRGHRRIAFLSSPLDSASTIQERYTGFQAAFLERGLIWDPALGLMNMQSTLPGGGDEREGEDVRRIESFLSAHADATCIFCTEYNITLLVFRTLQRLGFSIPKDLSLMGFDGPRVAFPPITRIVQRESDMGGRAVGLLADMMGEQREQQSLLLEPELQIADTVCEMPHVS